MAGIAVGGSDCCGGAKLKGAIVMIGKPANVWLDGQNPENAFDAVVPLAVGVPAARADEGRAAQVAVRVVDAARKENPLVDAGAAAVVVRDSGKPWNLFNMGGAGGNYAPSAIPTAFLTHEDYSLIYRLAQSGTVSMRVNLDGKFSDGPSDASITVAEIKGSQISTGRARNYRRTFGLVGSPSDRARWITERARCPDCWKQRALR